MPSSSVEIELPVSWSGVRTDSLRTAWRLWGEPLTAGYDADRLKTCYILAEAERQQIPYGLLTRWTLLSLFDYLVFMDHLPDYPVQLPPLAGVPPLDRELHGVPFSTYLQLENLYQGFLASGDEAALRRMAEHVWENQAERTETPDLFLVLLWYSGLKNTFADLFPSLFRPAGPASEPADMRQIMTAEIRALTGGDITKEDAVLSADTWSALTELDAKAREAEEWRRRQKS